MVFQLPCIFNWPGWSSPGSRSKPSLVGTLAKVIDDLIALHQLRLEKAYSLKRMFQSLLGHAKLSARNIKPGSKLYQLRIFGQPCLNLNSQAAGLNVNRDRTLATVASGRAHRQILTRRRRAIATVVSGCPAFDSVVICRND
jgi:hypothetical protein